MTHVRAFQSEWWDIDNMSQRTQVKSPTPAPLVVDVVSGDAPASPSSTANSSRLRQHGVIEVSSDVSEGEEQANEADVEIVGENRGTRNEDVEIVGHSNFQSPVYDIDYPGGPPRRHVPREPPRRRVSRILPQTEHFPRNVRRRHNQWHNRLLLQADFPSFLDYQTLFDAHAEGLLHFFQSRDNDISSSIMERISREEEHSLDRKIESENKHNSKSLQQKMGIACEELRGYTNDISVDDNLMCELCGVVLGEGIPADFEPNAEYDENLAQHVSESQVKGPWFCVRQCFTADKELSRRVFAAKCGHVFCGRCIKNIGNQPPARRGRNSNSITILNPQISAPKKCPAEKCGALFNKSKNTFTELFL